MKILTVPEIRAVDKYTIEHEPISSADLMERAATACYHWIISHFPKAKTVALFCGLGNNGGDGLVIARLLAGTKRYTVDVYIFRHSANVSEDFSVNLERLKKCSNVQIFDIHPNDEFSVETYDVDIDCLFGSGLNKPVSGALANAVQRINTGKIQTLISIDISSGLFADRQIGRAHV